MIQMDDDTAEWYTEALHRVQENVGSLFPGCRFVLLVVSDEGPAMVTDCPEAVEVMGELCEAYNEGHGERAARQRRPMQ